MKAFIVMFLGLSIFAGGASAAQLKQIYKMTDRSIESALQNIRNMGIEDSRYGSRIAIISKDRSERIEQTIKQSIYILRNPYSKPEYVDVSTVKKI